jgi:hypothetical protein
MLLAFTIWLSNVLVYACITASISGVVACLAVVRLLSAIVLYMMHDVRTVYAGCAQEV